MELMASEASITASVVPVALITSGGLFTLAFYNRLIVIIDRLRKYNHEMLTELTNSQNDNGNMSKIAIHKNQVKMLNHQAKLVKACILCVLSASISTLTSAFILSISATSDALFVARIFHAVGIGLMLTGILGAIIEMCFSIQPVMREEQDIEHIRTSQQDLYSLCNLGV